jgi:hypothetical protein
MRAVDELQQYDESHRHDNFTRRLWDVPKRIMVSTSGVPKNDKKMADDDVKFKLVVLHSGIDEIRVHAFSAKFWLIYANHWNIVQRPKSKISMNTWFERHQ